MKLVWFRFPMYLQQYITNFNMFIFVKFLTGYCIYPSRGRSKIHDDFSSCKTSFGVHTGL